MSDPRIKVEWTDELRAAVVKQWIEGMSAGDISATVPGSTRSGILGIIHRAGKKRMDLQSTLSTAGKITVRKDRQKRPKAEKPPKPKPAQKPKPLPAKGWVNGGTPIAGHIPPEPPAPEPLRLTLMELHSRSCRWPVTNAAPWRYCGHRVVGENSVTTPYCAHHARAALPKDNPKKPRSASQLERSVRQYL